MNDVILDRVIFTTVARRTAPGRILDGDLQANGVVVETGCDLDLEIAKLAFREGRRAVPQHVLDAYVPPPPKPGKKPKPELTPPSLVGITRLYIELRTCDESVASARRIYLEAAGHELDETPRSGYVRDHVHNHVPEWYDKYEGRTQWVVRFYVKGGAEAKPRWSCKTTGEQKGRLFCMKTALHLLRLGYKLGYNDVLAEDRAEDLVAV